MIPAEKAKKYGIIAMSVGTLLTIIGGALGAVPADVWGWVAGAGTGITVILGMLIKPKP